MDLQYLQQAIPDLLEGLRLTVLATLLGTALACGVGLIVAVIRVLDLAVLRNLVSGYVLFLRNTPLLIQLYFLFYVLPVGGIRLSGLAAGIVGIGLYFSTFASEAYRAGFDSVPRGQWEAGRALNLSPFQTLRLVVLPQALRPVIPALGNFLISIFKDSSLLATITVYELLGSAESLASFSFEYTTLFTAVGLTYLLLSYPSSLLVRRIETRLAVH